MQGTIFNRIVSVQCIEALLGPKGDGKVVERLISAALAGSLQAVTVWRLLLWTETHSPELRLLMQELKEKQDAQKLLRTSECQTAFKSTRCFWSLLVNCYPLNVCEFGKIISILFIVFFLVKDIDVLFQHKSLILETVTDTTLLEQGLVAKHHGTERFAEVRNGG